MISVYYNYDFEAHKNLSHKQLWLTVYYFMDFAVYAIFGSSPSAISGKNSKAQKHIQMMQRCASNFFYNDSWIRAETTK